MNYQTMKNGSFSVAALALITVITAVLFISSNRLSANGGPAQPNLQTTHFEDLEWIPLDPDFPEGVAMATLWGDPQKGRYGALLRVPANFESPKHTHSADEHIVQITGSSIHWSANETRATGQQLEVGDYFFAAGGVPHVSATGNEPSIELIVQDSAFDFSLTQ